MSFRGGASDDPLANSVFDVSATKQVKFTPGNLQYIGSAATPYWRIAENQYSYLGLANGIPSSTTIGSRIPANTDVDLFGWGEVEAPFRGSTNSAEYQIEIGTGGVNLTTDWATKFNGDSPVTLYADNTKVYPKTGGAYCCLTNEEWQYLFANQWWGFTTVTMNDGSTKNGIVLCPNTVDESTAGTYLSGHKQKSSSYTGSSTSRYTDNSISQNTIDKNGLLFLPAAGVRSGSSVNGVGSNGYYWSTTSASGTNACHVYFGTTNFLSAVSSSRYFGFSVRLAYLAQ